LKVFKIYMNFLKFIIIYNKLFKDEIYFLIKFIGRMCYLKIIT